MKKFMQHNTKMWNDSTATREAQCKHDRVDKAGLCPFRRFYHTQIDHRPFNLKEDNGNDSVYFVIFYLKN